MYGLEVCHGSVECLLLVSLKRLETLSEDGQYLVQVTYDTEVGYLEDGSKLVLVDGNDVLRLLHTSEVLDSS